jgi:hypothetical protein
MTNNLGHLVIDGPPSAPVAPSETMQEVWYKAVTNAIVSWTYREMSSVRIMSGSHDTTQFIDMCRVKSDSNIDVFNTMMNMDSKYLQITDGSVTVSLISTHGIEPIPEYWIIIYRGVTLPDALAKYNLTNSVIAFKYAYMEHMRRVANHYFATIKYDNEKGQITVEYKDHLIGILVIDKDDKKYVMSAINDAYKFKRFAIHGCTVDLCIIPMIKSDESAHITMQNIWKELALYYQNTQYIRFPNTSYIYINGIIKVVYLGAHDNVIQAGLVAKSLNMNHVLDSYTMYRDSISDDNRYYLISDSIMLGFTTMRKYGNIVTQLTEFYDLMGRKYGDKHIMYTFSEGAYRGRDETDSLLGQLWIVKCGDQLPEPNTDETVTTYMHVDNELVAITSFD